jgi:hypothetical protein
MKRPSTASASPKPDADPIARQRVRYAVRFLLIAGVLFSLYTFPYAEHGLSERWFESYLAGYARLVGEVLRLFEPGISVEGTTIHGRYALNITPPPGSLGSRSPSEARDATFAARSTRAARAIYRWLRFLR